MANDEKLLVSEPVHEPTGTSTPKGEKRCATESTEVLLEHASTPFRPGGKKRLVLECDRTPLAPPSLNSSSRSLALSTPGRVLSSSRMLSITRGIQTCPKVTANRYCQVSVPRFRKPTASTSAQTDEPLLLPPTTATVSIQTAIACSEIACQTEAPPAIAKSVAATQTISFERPRSPTPPPVERKDAECQADVVEDNITHTVGNEANEEEQEQPLGLVYDSDASDGPMVGSISNMLNEIAKQYGIDLQSSVEKKKKKKKPKVSKRKQIDHLERCLVNKTYKAIASKVDKQLSTILEKRAEEHGRQLMTSRQQLVRWTKGFIRRQHQKQQSTASVASRRKVILVRKIVRPPKRPLVKEAAVQCVPSELVPATATVSTQWQRQKPMVTKKTPASKQKKEPSSKALPKKSTTSTSDSKTCSAGAGVGTRQAMRQTKLSSYAKEQTDGKAIQGRQQRKQQGERSPKSSKSATAVAETAPSSSAKKPTKKLTPTPPPPPPPLPAAKKKPSNRKKPVPVPEKIHIEETPSDASSDSEPERKHFPYRSPPRYPSQCSKATETSFLTPTRIRNLTPIQEQNADRSQSRRNLNSSARNNSQMLNPSVLLSPMERMFMEPRTTTAAQTNNREYNTFLVPLRPTTESIPPTPPRMVYVNHPERRLLLRSRHSTGGMVREKPPEISIISSQQLYSQIGLAVEKALKAKTMPTLDTMYGDPSIEVFNGAEHSESENRQVSEARNEERATKQTHPPPVTNKFVCSSGREDVACLGSQQQHLTRPPFHTERSPSLSPIVYEDDNSGDEIML